LQIFREKLREEKEKKKKKKKKKKKLRVPAVIDNNPLKHVTSDSEEEDMDSEDSTDYELEPNEQHKEIMNVANDI
jgi:hypothetical protein